MADDIDLLAAFLKGDTSMLKCTVCGARAGTCDCWVKCEKPWCKWLRRKGVECNNPEHFLTIREISVLRYLAPLMEANVQMIGEHVLREFPANGKRGSGYKAVGAGIVARLNRFGLIYKITDLNAWRLTSNGRHFVSQIRANPTPKD